MTATTKESKPPSKPARQATLYNVAGHLTLRLATGRKVSRYHVEPIPADFGSAFEVTELENDSAETYQVLLAGPSSCCTCKGWTFCGFCKHLKSLKALRERGLI
jgi:hypothetical protein